MMTKRFYTQITIYYPCCFEQFLPVGIQYNVKKNIELLYLYDEYENRTYRQAMGMMPERKEFRGDRQPLRSAKSWQTNIFLVV